MITLSASIGRESRVALFSDCQKYRYRLEIIWDLESPLLVVIGLNPSTANETEPDNTITRVISISKFNGFGGIYMMNCFPIVSTDPDILKDDNTLRRVKRFAHQFHCGGVRMLNAFAWRSTDPRALFGAKDPVGPGNTIGFLASNRTALTIAAWGSTIQKKPWKHYYRGHDIAQAMPGLLCLRKTPHGHPEHPLYLPGDRAEGRPPGRTSPSSICRQEKSQQARASRQSASWI